MRENQLRSPGYSALLKNGLTIIMLCSSTDQLLIEFMLFRRQEESNTTPILHAVIEKIKSSIIIVCLSVPHMPSTGRGRCSPEKWTIIMLCIFVFQCSAFSIMGQQNSNRRDNVERRRLVVEMGRYYKGLSISVIFLFIGNLSRYILV